MLFLYCFTHHFGKKISRHLLKPTRVSESNFSFVFLEFYQTSSNYGDFKEYDPYLLDDPELRSGRHRKVLKLSSFMVRSVMGWKNIKTKSDPFSKFM